MPKNKGKGGKNRRRGANKNGQGEKGELAFKEDGQEYAQVVKMLGNGRIQAFCFDGVNRLCKIRGKLRKKVWINVGDVILLGIREFQDSKADVIMKYSPEESRKLIRLGELPHSTEIKDEDNDFEVKFGDLPETQERLDENSDRWRQDQSTSESDRSLFAAVED